MKKLFTIILALALCLSLAAPVFAAQGDYIIDDGNSYVRSADGSDGVIVRSTTESRVIYTVPFGNAWSVSFRVDLQKGNGGSDPEANARFGLLAEDHEMLALITAKTMIGRESPDTRVDVQQLLNNNWTHKGVVEWTPHSQTSYNVVVSKRAGDNRLHVVFTGLDGKEFIRHSSQEFNAGLMASAKYFTFYVWNSEVRYSNIKYTGFTPAPVPQAPIKVLLDGDELEFDVPPQLISGRTMVPMRVIFEALGADVDWDPATRKITAIKEDLVITLTIGSNVLTRNGEDIQLDVPARLTGGRTLVPIRAVSESFGAEVDWVPATRTVVITTDGESGE